MLTKKTLRFCRLYKLLERVHVGYRDFSEHLAVDRDVRFCELIDESAVGHSAHTRRSVDTNDPELAHVALFRTAVCVRMLESFAAAVLCSAVKDAVAADVTFDGLENLLLSSMVNYTCC